MLLEHIFDSLEISFVIAMSSLLAWLLEKLVLELLANSCAQLLTCRNLDLKYSLNIHNNRVITFVIDHFCIKEIL